MLVAMPTAMPPAPFTSRFGNRAGQHERLLLVAVVVRHEVDGLLVDVAEHLHRERRRAAPRCSGTRRRGRRRPSRSCRAGRSADSAARSPAPCAPARRRSLRRRAGGTCSSRRRRRWRTCGSGRSGRRPCSCIDQRIRRCTGFRPSRTSGSARPHDDRHRVVEVGALDLLLELDGLDATGEQVLAHVRVPSGASHVQVLDVLGVASR